MQKIPYSGIGVSLIHKRADGLEDFVHDTYREYFSAKHYAKKLSSGTITAKDLGWNIGIFSSDIFVRVLGNTVVSECKDSTKIKRIVTPQMVYFLVDMIKEVDLFILNLNKNNCHLAAGCIGRVYSKLNQSTIKTVVSELEENIKTRSGTQSHFPERRSHPDSDIEALGETRSALAEPILVRFHKERIAGNRVYTKKGAKEGCELVALSKINSESAIELVYDFITNPNIITGHHPPAKYIAFNALEQYANKELLANVLFRKIMSGALHRHFLLGSMLDELLMKEVLDDMPYKIRAGEELDSIEKAFSSLLENPLGDTMPSYNSDEQPHATRLLKLFGRVANKKMIEQLREVYFNAKFYTRAVLQKREYAGEAIPFLDEAKLDQIILEEERKEFEKVTVDGKESIIGKVYSEKKADYERAYVYLDLNDVKCGLRFMGSLADLPEAKAVDIKDSSEFKVKGNLFAIMAHMEGRFKLELTSENATEVLQKWTNKLYQNGYLESTTICKLRQFEFMKSLTKDKIVRGIAWDKIPGC